MPKTIAFATLKGGVGKSSMTFNMVGLLAKNPCNRILVIDADPQSNSTANFGLSDFNIEELSIKDIFETGTSLEEIIIESPLEEIINVDLLPSSILLTTTEFSLVSRPARESILKNYLEQHTTVLEKYTHVIFDTNPSMSIVNQNVFNAVDSIILVSDVNMNSYKGAMLFCDLWKNISTLLKRPYNVKGFIVNNVDGRTSLAGEFLDFVTHHPTTKDIYLGSIPTSVKIKQSELAQLPINYTLRSGEIINRYTAIYDEMIKRGIL